MFSEAIKYFNRPTYTENNRSVAVRAFIIFIFKLILLVILVGIFKGFIYAFNAIPSNTLKNFHLSSFQAYLLVALYIPIIEEVIFRLNLKISLNNLIIFFAFLSGYFFYRIFKVENLNHPWIVILTFTLMIVLIYIKAKKSEEVDQFLSNFWKRYFAIIFHASCCIFAFLHLFNFEEIIPTLLFLSTVIVLPQLILAYALGFLRMNYGFQYNVIFHILYNSLFFILCSMNLLKNKLIFV